MLINVTRRQGAAARLTNERRTMHAAEEMCKSAAEPQQRKWHTSSEKNKK